MGTTVEFKDTLKLTKENGFPLELNLEQHVADPESSRRFLGKVISFHAKGEVVYNHFPARIFLVEDIDGRWLYWGNGIVLEQTMGDMMTKGECIITKIYHPSFQKRMTIEESPTGKSYYSEEPRSLLDLDHLPIRLAEFNQKRNINF
ncbi:hypothetical protein HYT57_02145 [Candidatus Woesearchaeota archaeon]|nr:hypothetical protein [Candidatus Woesearchaeota archaeon]